jgi:hypothetical protein
MIRTSPLPLAGPRLDPGLFWRASAALAGYTLMCVIAGVDPSHPIALGGLLSLAAFPVPGLAWVMLVLMAPLGLWMIGVRDYLAQAAGGFEYAVSLSSVFIAGMLAVRALAQAPPEDLRRHLRFLVPAGAVLSTAVAIGVASHGFGQTVAGLRILLMPVIVVLALSTVDRAGLRKLMDLLAWLLIANAVAAVAEVIIGPAQLVAWGFENERAVRVIGETFRAPGLTEINAELGLLAGAYLLGYASLWLTGTGLLWAARASPGRRLKLPLWHAAAGASLICLILSTSRSGALLLAGGVVCAVLLDRSRDKPMLRWARLAGLLAVGTVAAGFVALGATGSSSLTERLTIWWEMAQSLTAFGAGAGSAGAATYSRAAGGEEVFVDNYFLNIAWQFGLVVLAGLLVLLVYTLKRLSARTRADHFAVVPLALLAGLAASALMLESWEFPGAMMALGLFLTLSWRLAHPATPSGTGQPERQLVNTARQPFP